MPLPFFLRRSREAERAFPAEPPELLALWLAALEATQPIAGALWGTVGALGVFVPPHRKWGSRGGFSISACRGHCFMALCPGNRTAHRWGTVEALAFLHRPTGSGEAERAFPSEPAGALICGSLPRKPHSSLPGCCGAMDASTSRRREWKPCHKRKKRRKFPPLF